MALDDYVKVYFESQLTGPVELDLDIELPREGADNKILGFLKPKVTVITAFGSEDIAPYGDPDATMREFIKLFGLVAIVITAGIIIYKTIG